MMNNQSMIVKRNGTPSWPSAFADLDAQIDSLFANLPSFFDFDTGNGSQARNRSVRPRWYESDDAFLARLDLPGVKPEDIEIEWKDNQLTISATRELFDAESGQDQLKYAASLAVPKGVDADRISAGYEHGVLSLTLPKSEKAKPRRIEVKAS